MSFFPSELLPRLKAPATCLEWEEVDCLLCGGSNRATLVEAPDPSPDGHGLWFAVVQCQDCGLCYTNPRPTQNSIGRFFKPPVRIRRRRTFCVANWRPRWLRSGCPERHSLRPFGQGRLLDVGCTTASFLRRMHHQGWQVVGLSPDAATAEQLGHDLRTTVYVGRLPHPELKHGRFDLLTMWNSLAQAHDPQQVLREARRLLAPGGRLLLTVPNIDSLPFRWFGPAWCGLNLPRHLVHFAPWTLQLMLERLGFRVGPIRMLRHSSWLRASARRARQLGRGPHWHRWLSARPASALATWYGYWTDQCDGMLVIAER